VNGKSKKCFMLGRCRRYDDGPSAVEFRYAQVDRRMTLMRRVLSLICCFTFYVVGAPRRSKINKMELHETNYSNPCFNRNSIALKELPVRSRF
jgi:hypothetical protein